MLYTLPLLLAVAIYGYAVSLPFFLDDGPHFNILAQTNGLQHWGDFPPFPFYRPLTFTLWKLFEPFGYSAPHMHLLNVLCFGAAGVMVGQVVRVLAPARYRTPAAVFAGCAFVVFPFSYQAIVMVAALFHLTLTLGMLVCIWAALRLLQRGQFTGNIGVFVLCWGAAFVGVFSHENGVLLAPFLALIIVLRSGITWRGTLISAPVFLIVAVYGVLWMTFSPSGSLSVTEDPFASFGVLLQGAIYPLAALMGLFIDGDIEPSVLVGVVVAVFAIAPIVVYVFDQRMGRFSVYGVLWYVLAILPAAILLPAGYVLGQPRLALLASVGGSMLWGLVFGVLWARNSPVWRVPALVMIAAFGMVSIGFLLERRADFERLDAWNRDALALFAANDVAKTGALLLNAPDYITPADADRWFVLGTEGALYVDESLDYNQQFWMNSDIDYAGIVTMAVPSLQRSDGFNFRSHPPVVEGDPLRVWAERSAQIYITHFDGLDFYPVLVGGTAVELAQTDGDVADYGGGAYVLRDAVATYDMQRRLVEVRLRWTTNMPSAVKTFTHVYCDDDFIAQSDGYPWGDTTPFATWPEGETRVDVRSIRLENAVDPACLRVVTGLYTEADVIRLEATDPQTGERYQDDAVPVERIDK